MATRDFTVSTVVPGDPAAVVDFLTDLSHHHGLHPFLVSAEVVATGQSADGPWSQWRVQERPRLGPIRYPIRFGARLTRTSATSFVSDVTAAPGCTIHARTSAEPHPDGGALVTEHATVRAPAPVVGYMTRQAQHAHERTYAALPTAFAT